MDIKKLFDMQKSLDKHIETKHNLLEEDLFDRKVLALLVEIGELANEARPFKFWSEKPPSPLSILLEEFVDGIHFILSLGIECGFEKDFILSNHLKGHLDLNELFLSVYEKVGSFRLARTLEAYKDMFHSYLHLAENLGFSHEQIEEAYFSKNEVNYQRQQQGY